MNIELSVIIPAYNAGAFIEDTLRRLAALLGESRELIVVDDGSGDDTFDVMRRFEGRIPNYSCIRLPRNRGKGFALREGMKRARGTYVAFTDADLPYGLSIFDEMLAVMKKDSALFLLYGSRSHQNSKEEKGYGTLRRFGRNFFSNVIRYLAVPDVPDTQCGIKMLTRELAECASVSAIINRFAFDIELFMIAKAHGWQYRAFPVTLTHRKESSVRLVRDTLVMLLDLLRIISRYERGNYA